MPRFGCNPDFCAFFALDGRADEGLLWVNHEYPDALFLSGYHPGPDPERRVRKTREQIRREKLAVGGSVLHVRRAADGSWRMVAGSPRTRRFTALFPAFEVTGGARPGPIHGTLANCSGSATPWRSVLSCEENYQDYNPPAKGRGWKAKHGWSDVPGEEIEELDHGWVVEIDPFGELPPRKHTALGRFAHENVALVCRAGRPLVLYMGDDVNDGCLYKFVSARPYDAGASRAAQSALLHEGTLYAASLERGGWIALRLGGDDAALRAAVAAASGVAPAEVRQEHVLCWARPAARALGATRLHRPEDAEVVPDREGGGFALYVAMTNHKERGDMHGSILRLREVGDPADPACAFEHGWFLVGGTAGPSLSCPDNLLLDPLGAERLWVACDVSSDALGQGCYERFGNNGLFAVDTSGPRAGHPRQLASGPNDSELTGPCFTPDGETLFLSVQHPGEETLALDGPPTSRWPAAAHRAGRRLEPSSAGLPLGAVVAIRRRVQTGARRSP